MEKFHNLKIWQFLSVLNPLNYWKFFSGIEMKILMRKLKKQDSKKISEEVADVLLYLLRFSEIAELDLEKICLKK